MPLGLASNEGLDAAAVNALVAKAYEERVLKDAGPKKSHARKSGLKP